MFRRSAAFIVIILLCASTAFANGREEIESMCAEKWRSNHQMRDGCIDAQLNAAELWLKNYFNKYVAAHIAAIDNNPDSTYLQEEAIMVYECSEEFKDSVGRYDYQMLLNCCDERFKEFNALKR